jgi:hypothetical protein
MSHAEDGKQAEKRLEIALQALTREINLFWQRALFFWGLIAVAFVAYAALLGKSRNLPLLISGLGVVCSFAWALANRANKFWQESWEQKVGRAEKSVTGPWVATPELPIDKGMWSGRPYSVGKLAIAVSDCVCAVWIVLYLNQVLLAVEVLLREGLKNGYSSVIGASLVSVGPVIFSLILFFKARSSPPIRQAKK